MEDGEQQVGAWLAGQGDRQGDGPAAQKFVAAVDSCVDGFMEDAVTRADFFALSFRDAAGEARHLCNRV
eukprot:1720613-Lingulodinium_polyedra.AAC.1